MGEIEDLQRRTGRLEDNHAKLAETVQKNHEEFSLLNADIKTSLADLSKNDAAIMDRLVKMNGVKAERERKAGLLWKGLDIWSSLPDHFKTTIILSIGYGLLKLLERFLK